jgi:hypothetical protein
MRVRGLRSFLLQTLLGFLRVALYGRFVVFFLCRVGALQVRSHVVALATAPRAGCSVGSRTSAVRL